MLDMLMNPLKNDFEFELWTIKELAVFESCLCTFGKRFNLISCLLDRKSLDDVMKLYNFWKFTSHYQIFKQKRHKKRKEEYFVWH